MNSLTRVLTTQINLRPIKALVCGFFAFLGRLPFALVVGCTTVYLSYLSARFLLTIPRGAVIRPMFEGAFAGFVVLLALVVGVPLAGGEIYRSVRDKRLFGLALGIAGLILCISTWEVGNYFWDHYQTQRGIQFEQ